MNKLSAGIIIVLFVTFVSGCDNSRGTTFKLYYLGGQSNMDGYGDISDLPEELNRVFQDVPIFHGNPNIDDTVADGRGFWTTLQPGHGAGFSSDNEVNRYSQKFGIELSFASMMQEIDGKSNIAILKYSRGGTSIDKDAARFFGSWDPSYNDGEGINQYDHFLAAVKNSSGPGDLDGDGIDDILIPSGILWMQGESDADVTEEIANRYYDNLTVLIGLIREAFGNDKIPVVIGRISDSGNDPSGRVWEYGDIVRKAQLDFSEDDKYSALIVSTDSYSYSDPWHYNSDGFIDLGKQFALKLDSLQRR